METLRSAKMAWAEAPDIGPQVRFLDIVHNVVGSLMLRSDGTVNRGLASKLMKTVPAERKPVNGVYTADFTIDSSKGLWCRVYVPESEKEKKLPLILYVHGGGFVSFDPNSPEYEGHIRRMAKQCNAVVVSLSYRKAPEDKHPVAYEDSFTGLEWVKSQSLTPHEGFPTDVVDFSRVFIAGDSSGGNIAHHIAVKAGTMDMSPLSVVGLILIQPFFGGEERTASEIQHKKGILLPQWKTDWFWRAFLPLGSDRDHPASNVSGPKSPPFTEMNLPKMLVVVGGLDPLHDRGVEYAVAMKSAGKECKTVCYEKAFHAFYFFGHVRSTSLLYEEIEDFVRFVRRPPS